MMTGKGTKKFRFPVAVHLDKAVGALTLHTGVGTINWPMGTKNANGYVGERRRLVKMLRITKMGDFFETSKG